MRSDQMRMDTFRLHISQMRRNKPLVLLHIKVPTINKTVKKKKKFDYFNTLFFLLMGHAISRKMFSAEQAFVIGEILCGQTCTTYTRFSKFLRIKACHYVNAVPLKPPCLFKVLPL